MQPGNIPFCQGLENCPSLHITNNLKGIKSGQNSLQAFAKEWNYNPQEEEEKCGVIVELPIAAHFVYVFSHTTQSLGLQQPT